MSVDTEQKREARLIEIIKHFSAYPYEEKIKMLQNNGLDIAFLSNPTEEMQMIAVHQNPTAILWIKNPSVNASMMAKLLS
jgi:ADP-heptose:LPS heptosyltransferase